eukprot:TRINITY_DN2507_c0_g1_i1.p1 TRINITY_DN2507_c0_g1~~TRINITY_DN2507_c0_g1_i1.p1  ORF type:complete len:621 (-),score=154.43 TRINITY_DN2507_c0_g1_i1:203-2065(-)
MRAHKFSLLITSLYLVFIIVGSASTLSKQSLGIAPQDEKYYKSEIIKCKDGSKKFTKAQLNDDFCDCSDGTDEPGTSACPEGKFYCRNAGHVPLTLFSSRVNDGICDCCDGSDEYDGKIKCQNTCWEAGKMARDKLKKKIATYQDGVIIRKQETEKAKQAIAKDEEELLKLQNEEKILKGHVQKLKELKEQIEKAEEQERLEKEKEEKRITEAENKANEQEKQSPETPDDDTKGVLDELPESLIQNGAKDSDDLAVEAENGHTIGNDESTDHIVEQHKGEDDDDTEVEAEANYDDGSEAYSEHLVKQDQEKSDNTEGMSREELGRLVASRWTGENAGKQVNELDGAKEVERENKPEIPDSTQDDDDDDDDDGYPSEADDDSRKSDEDEMEVGNMDDEYEEEDHSDSTDSYSPDKEDNADFSDLTTASSPSWLDRVRQTFQNVLQVVNPFKTPVDRSDAAHIRKEYDESSTKLYKLQTRISSLTDKLKHDFGMDKEFYSFYDRCFEHKQNKYVYKVCPFKQASQVEGHSTTQLGHWDKFEDSYRSMQFSHGDGCWNGPSRSLKVRLRCGLKNELTDVDEPSRCEYDAILSTPALCQEEKLKELQHKLELMNTDQPQSRDEL